MRGKTVLTAVMVGLAVCCLIARGSAEEPILIGSPLPLTGPYASDGEQMKMALELAIEEQNAAGGLLGRTPRWP